MTRLFATNAQNDIYIDKNGNLAIFQDLLAVLQACEHAAKTLLGEMILATDQGIPYFQSVWNGVPSLQQFEAALRTAFLAVDEVVEVVSLFTLRDDDNLNYTAVIRTTFGGGSISG